MWIFLPNSKVPAYLNVVDIAGLVKGAAEGQGLGNAFLSHISACDAIFHLCRKFEIDNYIWAIIFIGSSTNFCLVFIIEIGAFDDPDVTHVEGEVDPVRDLEIISEELRLKDVETLEKTIEKMERTVIRANDKKLKPEFVSHSNEISLKE